MGSSDEGVCGVINRVIKEGLTEKMTFLQKSEGGEGVSQADIWESIPDRGNSTCKGPEVGAMPGMFEDGQDGHCGQRRRAEGKPEGMRPRWDTNNFLLSSQSRDEGESDLLSDGPAQVKQGLWRWG